ncbi:MAG: O-antigen ligase family protein [Acidobacteriota bacterium]
MNNSLTIPYNKVDRVEMPRERLGIAFPSLLLFLILLCTAIQNAIPTIGEVGPAQLIAIVALTAAILGKLVRGESLVLTGQTYLLGLFIGLAALTVPAALWPGQAFSTLLDALKIAAIFLLISNVVTDLRRLSIVVWTICLSGLIPALGTIKNYLMGVGLVDGFRAAWVGVYANPNDLAYTLAMFMPLALALASSTRRWSARLLALSCMGLYTLAIFLSFSRMGFLCLLFILIMTLLRSQQRVRNFLLLLLLAFCCLPILPISYWQRTETITEYDRDHSSLGRLQAWKAGLEMFQEHPLLGVGAGCYILGWSESTTLETIYRPRSAHNTFFQALAELGLFGFLAFSAFLLVSWRLLWRLKRELFEQQCLLSKEIFTARYRRLLAIVIGLDMGFGVFVLSSLTGGLLFSWFPYIFSALAIAAHTSYQRAKLT